MGEIVRGAKGLAPAAWYRDPRRLARVVTDLLPLRSERPVGLLLRLSDGPLRVGNWGIGPGDCASPADVRSLAMFRRAGLVERGREEAGMRVVRLTEKGRRLAAAARRASELAARMGPEG